jgi:hypothetical protein
MIFHGFNEAVIQTQLKPQNVINLLKIFKAFLAFLKSANQRVCFVNGIIRLMLSVYLGPKVITSSGTFCTRPRLIPVGLMGSFG